MIRPTVATVLLSLFALAAQADDLPLPNLPGDQFIPAPLSEPAPLPGPNVAADVEPAPQSVPATATQAIPYETAPDQYTYGTPMPVPLDGTAPAFSTYGATPAGTLYGSMPMNHVGTSGCGCQSNATVYSGSSLGISGTGMPGGGMETYTGAVGAGMHVRHPYYSYRRPWYANGPMSHNVTIVW